MLNSIFLHLDHDKRTCFDCINILGGNDTKLGEFPWASLLRKVRPDGKELWHCGATLLNKWYVSMGSNIRDTATAQMIGLGDHRMVI